MAWGRRRARWVTVQAADEERGLDVLAGRGGERDSLVPPAEHARRAHSERVEGLPQRPRVAPVRVGVDAARHAEDEAVPLVAVVAEHLALQAERHARYLGEPLLRGVGNVIALLAVPDRVDEGVELSIREVRVAEARGMQVEEEGVGPVGGDGLESGAQPAEDRALVRRPVEVDAVDVEVFDEPEDALDPVVVPARRECGRVYRGVDLAVGQTLVPRRRVVGAHVLPQPRVATLGFRGDEHLAVERAQRPELDGRRRELAHRVVELHLGADGVGLRDVLLERLDGEEGVVDVPEKSRQKKRGSTVRRRVVSAEGARTA